MNPDCFLADIIANLDDDTPRLIFADWLDDHDQADRATFIRLQIQHARLPWRSYAQRNALDDQCRKLLDRHLTDWSSDVPKALSRAVRFQRGFVGELQLTAAQLLKVSARSWSRLPIQELKLHDVAGQVRGVLALPRLPQIRRMLLAEFSAAQGSGFTEEDLLSLAGCSRLEGLRELTLIAPMGDLAVHAVAACPSLAGLTYLRLDSSATESAIRDLVASTNVRNLEQLDLAVAGPAGARALAQAPDLGCLTMLLISGLAIGDEGLAHLAGSPQLAQLQYLFLSHHHIGPRGAEALARTEHLKRLEELHLSFNDLGDEGATVLAGSQSTDELRSLNLQGNQIGPAGATALARSPNLTGLLSLDLTNNFIGGEGGRALAESKSLARLRSLSLSKSASIPPDVELLLRERFGERLWLH